MNAKIWFISVYYRPNWSLIRANLRKLQRWPVVLVDNREVALQKAPAGQQIKPSPQVTILNPHCNLGFGAGSNLGAAYALKHGAQWVVILNDDLVLDELELIQFVKAVGKAPPGLVGAYAGRLEPKHWTTIFDHKPQPQPDYLSGGFLAVHRNVIKTLGELFCEKYFLYYEDVELSLRARRLGFPLTWRSLPKLVHLAATVKAGSSWQQYYLARNHFLMVERNAPLAIKLRELLRLPKTILEHQRRGQWSALLGIRDYWLRRFGNTFLL